MVRIKIAENNPHLRELQFRLAKLGADSMPRTTGAMADGAKLIQNTWRNYALGGPLQGVKPLKNGSRGYAQSIKTRSNGPFSHEIYSEADIADRIENGTKELDMKTTHPYGPRSRVAETIISKKTGRVLRRGGPYLIVPFQWGTKEGTKRVGPRNIVPKDLLSLMRSKRFKRSTVKNRTYLSPNARGQMVERWTCTWGDRARGSDFAGTVEQKLYANGMVRFEQGEKGGKKYGGYFTFRIISANSPKNSWIKPATPPRNVTRRVQEYTEDTIEKMVDAAIMEDLG
jgi:hypothetical protein